MAERTALHTSTSAKCPESERPRARGCWASRLHLAGSIELVWECGPSRVVEMGGRSLTGSTRFGNEPSQAQTQHLGTRAGHRSWSWSWSCLGEWSVETSSGWMRRRTGCVRPVVAGCRLSPSEVSPPRPGPGENSYTQELKVEPRCFCRVYSSLSRVYRSELAGSRQAGFGLGGFSSSSVRALEPRASRPRRTRLLAPALHPPLAQSQLALPDPPSAPVMRMLQF